MNHRSKGRLMFNDSFNRFQFTCLFLMATLLVQGASLFGQDDASSFRKIFDGKSFEGWKGDTNVWRVEDGTIVGESTEQNPVDENTFLLWDFEVDDFELKLKYRITGSDSANSGIQIRSSVGENGELIGYQADIDRAMKYTGIVYDELTGRKVLCPRGNSVTIAKDGSRAATEITSAETFNSSIKRDDWNEYHIRCYGNQITLKINGITTADLTDQQVDAFDRTGKLALQVHSGPSMKVEFKDIELKRLPLANGQKKAVFIAGGPSHQPGSHEHRAGCILLQDRLARISRDPNELPVLSTRHEGGWPKDPTTFDNADTVVFFLDGGGRHYLLKNMESFESLMDRGVGLVCIHYSVEVPKKRYGNQMMTWLGGYFETDWSVNPIWEANFESIPEHPVTRGVKPFQWKDEFYYHMRFVPEMARVTPLLSALPPKDSLSRKDGPHENNPDVRKAVLEEKKPQHVAWAYQRGGDSAGRAMGFTGAHFHKTWANDEIRKLVLNGILWTAHAEVPANGVVSKTPDDAELQLNIDRQ
jgi:type 1 glutamine amidotransferase